MICRFSAEKFNTFHPLPASYYLWHYILGIPGTTRYDYKNLSTSNEKNFPLGPFTFPLLFFPLWNGEDSRYTRKDKPGKVVLCFVPVQRRTNGTDSEGELIWENSSATYLSDSGYRSAGSGLALTLLGEIQRDAGERDRERGREFSQLVSFPDSVLVGERKAFVVVVWYTELNVSV